MNSGSEISPPPRRTYPFVYEAWRQTRPESYPRYRELGADNQVFARPYEVPRQVIEQSVSDCSVPPSCSGRTGQRPGTASGSADDDDGRHSRIENTHPLKENTKCKSNKPSSVSSLNQDSIMSEDSDAMCTKSCHHDKYLLKALIKAVKDIKLTTTEKGSTLNVIPQFDPMAKGQTVDSWIKKVEYCRDFCDWSDKQTTYYAILKLSGAAKSWYLSLPTVIFTWEDLKEQLTEVFPGTQNYAELLTDMLSVTYSEEPLELYYQQKMQLLQRCNITGKEAVDCLVHGLRDKVLRVAAQANQFTEPEQVLKFLKSVK